ncbi:MAG: outer membrane beta-barrel protein [Nitrobacter sp.]
MMRKMIIGVLLLTCSAGAAQARDDDFYVGVEAGVTLVDGDDLTFTPGAVAAGNGTVELGYDRGIDGGAFFGYDFGPVRIEAEASYRSAGLGTVNSDFTVGSVIVAGPRPAGGGKVTAVSFMGNAMLDFGKNDGLSFFVGGGVGYAKIRYEGLQVPSTQSAFLDDGDAGFAWQLIAGVRHPISNNIDITARYRFFNAGDAQMVGFGGRGVDGSFRSHSLMAGISLNF